MGVVLYDRGARRRWFAAHVELCRQVPGADVPPRHLRGPVGDPPHAYYAEFEFPDRDAFKAAGGAEFRATGKDAADGPARSSVCSPRLESLSRTRRFRLARRARLRAHRLREGAAAGDDHAQPAGGAERVRLPDAPRARRACEDASWDDEIRVVVVTGAGRAFCVGADLKGWGAELVGNPREYWKWFGAFKDMHDRLSEIGKPTVARINGICVGGGNELQMACDLAVMVDDAFIRHVGLEHGSVPAGGATQWLPIMVGDRRAREILLLCEEIPAAQAAEWGLVNWAVPAAELDATVDELVEKLAEAAADDPLRQAAAQLLARPVLARDRQPRPRLARPLDAERRGEGRAPCGASSRRNAMAEPGSSSSSASRSPDRRCSSTGPTG